MEQKREIIKNFFKDLVFEEEYHRYFLNKKPLKTSVSGVIKNFVKPFETDLISKKVSISRQISQKEVLKEWEDKRDKACNTGNITHDFAEKYAFDKNMFPETKYQEAIVKFWEELPLYIYPVFSEIIIYHLEYLFGGTIDLLLYNMETNTYIIADYKTNGDIFKNYKKKKMLSPFQYILESPYNKGQLQLSFYQVMLEQIKEIKVSSRKLIWLRPDGNYHLYDTKNYTEEIKEYLKNNKIC